MEIFIELQTTIAFALINNEKGALDMTLEFYTISRQIKQRWNYLYVKILELV